MTKTEAYESQIVPHLKVIWEIAKEAGINFNFVVELDKGKKGVELRTTQQVTNDPENLTPELVAMVAIMKSPTSFAQAVAIAYGRANNIPG